MTKGLRVVLKYLKAHLVSHSNFAHQQGLASYNNTGGGEGKAW